MDRMPFYAIEELMDSLKDLAEKEAEERRKQEGKQNSGMPNMNLNSMTRQLQQNSMPTMPNFKI